MTLPEIKNAAIAMRGLLDDKKCEDILLLDMAGVNPLADFFLIATASSSPQIGACVTALCIYAKEAGCPALTPPETGGTRWSLIDFSGIVVHLFTPEGRAYYELENLWHDAARIS
ncbi:MAG: ribosome silencing factor [Spirochaetes bacterium]|nr:ribosome silencing factor [Spirochaetota bacterium]